MGKHQRHQHRALDFFTGGVHCRIVSRPLGTPVETAIVVAAIAVVFQIGVVMLFVVTDQIVERKSVMCSDEID